jgi:hypothetical protein
VLAALLARSLRSIDRPPAPAALCTRSTRRPFTPFPWGSVPKPRWSVLPFRFPTKAGQAEKAGASKKAGKREVKAGQAEKAGAREKSRQGKQRRQGHEGRGKNSRRALQSTPSHCIALMLLRIEYILVEIFGTWAHVVQTSVGVKSIPISHKSDTITATLTQRHKLQHRPYENNDRLGVSEFQQACQTLLPWRGSFPLGRVRFSASLLESTENLTFSPCFLLTLIYCMTPPSL